MNENKAALKRSITLPQLLFYGGGTMVGGGFYALTGKVAGEAGMAAPVAFLLAGLLALANGFTFAELSSRMPYSAGGAHYAQEAFRRPWFSMVVGWLIITTGVVSAGTLAVATVGFASDLIAVPEALGIVLVVAGLGLVAAWGIGESVKAIVTITAIEVAALFYILFAAGGVLTDLPARLPEILPDFTIVAWIGVMSGTFLAFYSFLGFEDLVSMAEEVKDARRALPIGILVSVAITTTLYVAVLLVAVLAVDPAELAAANTPFALILGGTGGFSGKAMVVVSILTGINGALVQIIMAARVAYGMARQSRVLKSLGEVHPRTQTPLKSTALMTGIVLLLALFFPLVTLAKATSAIILIVFAILNLALWRIKRRGDPAPKGARTYPIWTSALGFAACVGVLAFQLWSATSAH